MKTKLLLILFFVASTALFAQVPVGEWTNYQSYRSASKLTEAGDLIFCTGNGALFTYNKTDNSVQKLSSINGLSDVGIESLAYGAKNKVILLAYENSNIDLIFEKEIFNLSDIKRKQIMGNKAINSIMFDGDLAYLACGFGIVVINTTKKEVKDTWYIANNGDHINVYDIATSETSIFAATEEGIYFASINEPNLQDYSNWQKINNIAHANSRFTQIEILNGKITACYSPDSDNDEIYQLNNGNWQPVYTEIRKVFSMNAFADRMVIANEGDVYVFNEQGTVTEKIYQYLFADSQSNGIDPRFAVLSSDGSYWIADNKYGLIRKNNNNYQQYSPNGPINNQVFSLYNDENNLWIAAGGRNAAWGNSWNMALFQKYSAGTWTAFDESKYPEMAKFRDVVCIVSDPNDPEHVFVGCWGAGVLEFQGDKFVNQHSYHNSSLQTVVPNADYVRIGGMTFDSDGTLWVNNGGATNILSSYKNGQWKSYSLPEVSNGVNFGDIVITEDGDKWIALSNRNKDIYVVKGENEDRKWQRNIAYFSNGDKALELEMHEVYCMTKDREDAIWVGATGGIAVYDNPARIWSTDDQFYARQPGLEMGDGIYHPLLASETVTAIAVDGGNRKWCGTKANGVFLISDDGEKEIEHFTVENSPLLSNEITSIAINNKSGEVYFGTSEGLISFQGVATEPEKHFTDVYVYPNPVRETYDGPIIVTGLMEDTDVKITDISGNLVFHDTSVGGQVSWDGKNLNGNRCHTGVYLVFLNNKSGEETFVTKLLFIH